jgi:hypothetical protein
MRLSLYTFVKDGLYFDFHVVDMLKHHLPLADEIIVNEGFSSDGTYEAINGLDPKIKVHRLEWDTSDVKTWYLKFKEQARRLCSGDWCILLDCDEFIPEWEFDRIREFIRNAKKPIAQMKYVHFYANYRVYNRSPEKYRWPVTKAVIHRNLPEMRVWGDGSNVLLGDGADAPDTVDETTFECHHFGCVRHAARLRQKWRMQYKINFAEKPKFDRTPGFVYDWLPHKWDDPDFLNDLAVYDGPLVKAVRDNPAEFVRDDWRLLELLQSRVAQSGRSV